MNQNNNPVPVTPADLAASAKSSKGAMLVWSIISATSGLFAALDFMAPIASKDAIPLVAVIGGISGMVALVGGAVSAVNASRNADQVIDQLAESAAKAPQPLTPSNGP